MSVIKPYLQNKAVKFFFEEYHLSSAGLTTVYRLIFLKTAAVVLAQPILNRIVYLWMIKGIFIKKSLIHMY